jgi:hypothetical protein
LDFFASFDLDFLTFISSCGFGFIRTSAPIRRLVSSICLLGAFVMTTKKFDFTKEQAEDSNQAHAEFHHAYGVTMAQWGGVERALYYWFLHVTQLNDSMARAIFYSARSFNARAEMLLAAIEQTEGLDPKRLEFVNLALKRAWGYSAFRNSMAHGEPIMNIIDLMGQPRKITYSIVQGKTLKGGPGDISMEDLKTATKNFYDLKNLLIDTHPTIGDRDPQWPAKGLQQLNALPSQASSKSDQNQEGPSSRPQSDGRVNKKEHRASQRAAKGSEGGE